MSMQEGRGRRRWWMVVSLAIASLMTTAMPQARALTREQSGQAQEVVEFDIPAQPLARALAAWALKTGFELSYAQNEPLEVQSQAVSGKMTPEAALTRLLSETGFTYRYTDSRVVTLERIETGDVNGARVLGPVRVEANQLARSSSSAAYGPGAGNEVEYRQSMTEGTGSYATGGVTVAGKMPLSQREIPGTVSVVTRQRIDDQDLRSVGDALAQTPGVYVTSGLEREVIPATRGFINRDGFQVDGVPLQNPMPWAGGLSTSNLSLYDRVEFRKGPDGLMQGFGTPGGTVNLVRRRPDAKFGARFAGSGGRWDNYRGEGSVTGPLSRGGRVRGLAIGSYQRKNFYFDAGAAASATAGSVGLDVDVTRRTTVRTAFDYERGDQPFNDGLFLLPNNTRLPFPRNQGLQPSWARWETESWSGDLRLEHALSNEWRFTASATRRHALTDSNGLGRSTNGTGVRVGVIAPLPLDETTTIRAAYFQEHYNQTVMSYDANVTGKFRLFGRTHELLSGVNLRRARTDNWSATPVPVFVPIFYDVERDSGPEMSLPPGVMTNGTVRDGGLYGVLRAQVTNRITAVAGARYGAYESQSFPSNAAATISDQPFKITPYGGVIVDLSEIISAYASYSEILQSQAQYLDINGAPLDPVAGEQYEAGLKLESHGGRLTGSLSYFNIALDGSATLDPASVTADRRYFNGPPRKSTGGEFEVTGSPLAGLELTTSYTYNKSTFTSYSTYPRHLGKLFANYRLQQGGVWRRVSLGGGWNYQSIISSPYTGVTQPGYGVATFRAGFDVDPRTNIGLNVNNLFDKEYWAVVSWGSARDIYGTPREWIVTIRRSF
jgi:outer-membrane receptor for ferric coprogen and ferric-rhodotorulic acid